MMTWTKASLAIGVLVAVQALLIYSENAHRLWMTSNLTGTTQATITSLDYSFHNTAHYRYTAGDKVFQSGSAGWASDAHVGESIVIHYNPNNPWQNRLGNFAPLVPIDILWQLTLIDITAMSILLVTYKARKKSHT